MTGLFDLNFGVREITDIDSPYINADFFKSTPDEADALRIAVPLATFTITPPPPCARNWRVAAREQ